MRIYCIAGYFDNVQNVIGGVLRGVGITQGPALIYLVCRWDEMPYCPMSSSDVGDVLKHI